MNNLATLNYYVPNSSSSTGTVFNTKPSGAAYLITTCNVGNGTLAEGNVIQLGQLGNVTCQYVTSAPSYASDYKSVSFNATEYRYWVSKSGNTGLTEIYPNENGVFVMPFTAQYFFVTRKVSFSGMSSWLYWFPIQSVIINIERPEDQNEVAAISDQTTQLKDTSGSDTVTGDVTSSGTQQIESLSLWQSLKGISEQLQQAITTTESDTTIVFPGVNFQGFTMPSVEVDPLAVSPIPPDTIRGFITFLFVCWYLSYMRNLIANIFNLRWYNYDGEIYDEGTRTGLDNPNGNWGLVE